MQSENGIQVWGGIEGTINRVHNNYHDQCAYSGHYTREGDIDLIASLGIKMLRYPVLWEKHAPEEGQPVDWTFVAKNLERLKKNNVTPIAGLVHHGSGPHYVNFFDGSFENGLAIYARQVAEKFPWLEYYTPVNEPLTTARFCGLYGHWYPHGRSDYSFYKILISECKATVLAMNAIREINPDAKLIQTEDLGKCYATPLLQYQAAMENERRWVSYELLCGRLTPDKMMWGIMLGCGITESELQFFIDNPCVPHVAGFNYYITSERFLDENIHHYPEHYHGGNGIHQYADIETVKARMTEEWGPHILLREAWDRLQLPMAITECHLHSTREDQIRWFYQMWEVVNKLKNEGVNIQAITVWAILGLYGWNCLVTRPWGDYEPGVFNLSAGYPRPTALARLIQLLTKHNDYYHPILETEGWWKRADRLQFPANNVKVIANRKPAQDCQPLLILGKNGTLGAAFSRLCNDRNIYHTLLSHADLDITDSQMVEQVIQELNPWAIVNAAGYVNVDGAEKDEAACFDTNAEGPAVLAALCRRYPVKLLHFSTDLVFNGRKKTPYVESDTPAPLNVYGKSKQSAEEKMMRYNPHTLIVRTSSFFGPWDEHNFVTTTLQKLKEGREVMVANDVTISPTYVPDLVHVSLDLLLDDEHGIFHVTNDGQTTWAELAHKAAELAGLDTSLIKAVPLSRMRLKAKRPYYSALKSEKGIKLPSLECAMRRYMEACAHIYQADLIAV